MQRQGNDAIKDMRAELFCQAGGEPLGQHQLMSVFQRMNHAVYREIIAKKRGDAGKVGGLDQAAATTFAMRRACAALGAGVFRLAGKVCLAGWAQQFCPSVSQAKQAASRQPGRS